jgi:hypothetical protein
VSSAGANSTRTSWSGDVLGPNHHVVVDDVDGDTADDVGDGGRLRLEPVVESLQLVVEGALGLIGLHHGEAFVDGGVARLVELVAFGEADGGRTGLIEPDPGEHCRELLTGGLGEPRQFLAAGGAVEEPFRADLEVALQRFDQFGGQVGGLCRCRFGLSHGGGRTEQQYGSRAENCRPTCERTSHECLPYRSSRLSHTRKPAPDGAARSILGGNGRVTQPGCELPVCRVLLVFRRGWRRSARGRR